MTEYKAEIIKLMLESDNLEEAVTSFAKIIDFLKQNEASAEQVSAFLQENFQVSR